VRLPADPGLGQQHGELVGEAERHDRPDDHVDRMPVEESPDHDVAEVAEHHPAGARAHGVRGLGDPGGQAAGQHDEDGHVDELLHAPVGGEEAEDEQRPRVPLDVSPAEVQERRGEDVRQAADVARPDPVVQGDLVVVGPVHDLDEPQHHQDASHDEERLARLGQHRLRVPGAQIPPSPGRDVLAARRPARRPAT